MRKMNKPKGKLPWHSAFYAGIYKVLGYACFYKSDVQYVDTIKVEGITISM